MQPGVEVREKGEKAREEDRRELKFRLTESHNNAAAQGPRRAQCTDDSGPE